jgi:hypothetical protein
VHDVSDDVALVAALGTSTVVLLLALYGGIALVRRRRLSPLAAAVFLALAWASFPWIVRAFGLRFFDMPAALEWSVIIFVIVAIGSAREFGKIPRAK